MFCKLKSSKAKPEQAGRSEQRPALTPNYGLCSWLCSRHLWEFTSSAAKSPRARQSVYSIGQLPALPLGVLLLTGLTEVVHALTKAQTYSLWCWQQAWGRVWGCVCVCVLSFFPTHMGVNKPSFKVTLTAMKLTVSKLEHKSSGTGSCPAIHMLLDHIFKYWCTYTVSSLLLPYSRINGYLHLFRLEHVFTAFPGGGKRQ